MTDSPPVIRVFGGGRRRKATANDRSGRKVTEFARVRMTKKLIFSARPPCHGRLTSFNCRKLPYVGPCGRRGQYRQQYREFPSETSLFHVCQYRKVPARSRRTVRSGRAVEPHRAECEACNDGQPGAFYQHGRERPKNGPRSAPSVRPVRSCVPAVPCAPTPFPCACSAPCRCTAASARRPRPRRPSPSIEARP